MADLLDVLSSGRWTPECDQLLTTLRTVRASGQAPDATTAAMVAVLEAMLRGVRFTIMDRGPRVEDQPSTAELDEAIADLESAVAQMRLAGPALEGLEGPVRMIAGLLLIQRASRDVPDEWDRDLDAGTVELLARARDHLDSVPPDFADGAEAALAMIATLERRSVSDEQASVDADKMAAVSQEWFDAGGGDIHRVTALARQARQTRAPADLAAAISELRTLRRGLPAGHPAHPDVLVMLASLLGLRATLTQSKDDLAEAIDAAIVAVRAMRQPSVEIVGHLVGALGAATVLDQRVGPFDEAERALDGALANADPDDALLRVSLLVGLGAARFLRWRTAREEDLRRLAREALDEAERLLPAPAPTDRWCGPAWNLLMVNATQATLANDAAAAAAAARMIDRVERLLVGHPDLARRMAGMTAPGAFAALGLGDGDLTQSLRLMKQFLPFMSMAGALGLPAPGHDIASAQVSAVLGRFTQGRMGEPVDFSALMQAAAAELRNDPQTFRTAVSAAMGVPVAPAPPSVEETGLLARRGLDRAGHALGTGRFRGSPRRPLAAAGRPDPAALRTAVEDLRGALAGGLADHELRHRVHGAFGSCLAELYWLGEAAPPTVPDSAAAGPGSARPAQEPAVGTAGTLADAIDHLERVLAGSEHAVPTVPRADLLDVLARCYRESARRRLRDDARHDADRTARAALREIARCVLLADSSEQALEIAARANEIVARVVGWCLADDRPKAAVEVAETGRSLVLASGRTGRPGGGAAARLGAARRRGGLAARRHAGQAGGSQRGVGHHRGPGAADHADRGPGLPDPAGDSDGRGRLPRAPGSAGRPVGRGPARPARGGARCGGRPARACPAGPPRLPRGRGRAAGGGHRRRHAGRSLPGGVQRCAGHPRPEPTAPRRVPRHPGRAGLGERAGRAGRVDVRAHRRPAGEVHPWLA
jgi:hypothetical protein